MNYRTITVPANSVYNHNENGKVFACVIAATAFFVRADHEGELAMGAGRGFGNPNTESRARLTFRNTSGAPIDITFYWGYEEFRPDPSVVSASVSVSGQNVASYANGLAAGLSTLLTGTTTANFTGTNGTDIRKQFIVTNLNKPVANPNTDIPDVLWILGANGNLVGVVFPQQSFTFESGAVLALRNPSAGAQGGSGNTVTYSVGEIFYDLP